MLEVAAGVAFAAPDIIAGMAFAAPDIIAGMEGVSPVFHVKTGATHIGNAIRAAATALSYVSSVHNFWANEAGMQATWERRARNWALQMQTAAKELEQINKQKLAADIRIDIATQELANHERQLENAREIEAFY